MASTNWRIDPNHSSILFIARHMVVARVHGRFERFEGTLAFDPDDLGNLTASVDIEAASVNTSAPDRDQHLRSPDFLDAQQHPTIAFRSTRMEKGGLTGWQLHGELTIRGVSKPVVLETRSIGKFSDPFGSSRFLFSAKTSINRSDFAITWNKALDNGGWLVSERLEIELDVQAVQA